MQPWIDFDASVNTDEVLRGQGMDPERIRSRKPALVKAAERALVFAPDLIQAKALVREVAVTKHSHNGILLDGSNRMTGPLVTTHLAGARSVSAILVTIGPDLEQESTRIFDLDPLLAMALDGLGNATVEAVAQQVCCRIGEQAQRTGLSVSTPLSPGEPDWPVEIGQPQIFALLDPARLGIKVTPSGMMFPKKSISFILGTGLDMSRIEPCRLCNLRESCRYHD